MNEEEVQSKSAGKYIHVIINRSELEQIPNLLYGMKYRELWREEKVHM